MADDKRKSLYDKISTKYDLGSFDEFSAKLDQPGKIKSLYDKLSNDFDLGDYAEFEGKLKKKEPTVSESPSPDGTSPSQSQTDYVNQADMLDPLEVSRRYGRDIVTSKVRDNERSLNVPSPSSPPLPQDAIGASLSGTDMAQTVPPQSPQTAPAKTQESGVEPQTDYFFKGNFGGMLRAMDAVSPIPLGGIIDEIGRTWASGQVSNEAVDESLALMMNPKGQSDQDLQAYVDAVKLSQSMPPSKAMQNFNRIYEQEGGDFWAFAKAISKNPKVAPEVMLSSISAMFNAQSLTAAGGVVGTAAAGGAVLGGGVGAIPAAIGSLPYAMAAAGTVLETATSFTEFLQEELSKEGKEFTKENIKAILEDDDKMNVIRAKAAGRGIIIGAVDAFGSKLSGSIGARFISRGTRAGAVKGTLAGAGIEAMSGSGGEAAARAATGQRMDAAEIGLEGIGEMVQTPVSILSNLGQSDAKTAINEINNRRQAKENASKVVGSPLYKINGEVVSKDDILNIVSSAESAESIAGAKFDISNDPEMSAAVNDHMEFLTIRDNLKKAYPDYSQETINELTVLERDLVKISQDRTESANIKRSKIQQEISDIHGNQKPAPAPAQEPAPTPITQPTPEPTPEPTPVAEPVQADVQQPQTMLEKLRALKRDEQPEVQPEPKTEPPTETVSDPPPNLVSDGNGNLTEVKPAEPVAETQTPKPQEATPTETKTEPSPQPEAVKAEPPKSDGAGSDKVTTPKTTTNDQVATGDKVAAATTRSRPSEMISFDKPIIGKNGAQLLSYEWAYEWDMRLDREGELTAYRKSNWDQSESNAATGRDIVHKFTVKRPDGTIVRVSSETVPIELGYLDAKQMKNFPAIATAVKTLAKQKMELGILEDQKRQYDEAYQKYSETPKPEIKVIEDPWDKEGQSKGKHNMFQMGDVTERQYNTPATWEEEKAGKWTQRNKPTPKTVKELTDKWIKKRLKEQGIESPSGIYDLQQRIKRQERKVAEATKSEVSTTKTTTNEKETQEGKGLLSQPAKKATTPPPASKVEGDGKKAAPVTPEQVKAKADPTGAVITPNKEVKANQQVAIEEVVAAFYPKMGKMEAGMLYGIRKGDTLPSSDQGLKQTMQEKLENLGYIEENENGYYVPTELGQQFIDRVNARLATRRGVKEGTDLFPEMANIPEFNEKIKKIKQTEPISDEAIKRITEQDTKELRQSATDIERKAESSKEADLVKAVEEADAIIGEPTKVETPAPIFSETKSERFEPMKKEMGKDWTDTMQAPEDNQYYRDIETHVRAGGKITKEVYDNLNPDQQKNFDKQFNVRGNKVVEQTPTKPKSPPTPATEAKDLNAIYAAVKAKHGDKKGGKLYDTAIRLVNPNQNQIVEIRSNGVVVKEGEKYIFKPFTDTDLTPISQEKWKIGKGWDITEQFAKKTAPEVKPEPIEPDVTVEKALTEKQYDGLSEKEFLALKEIANTPESKVRRYGETGVEKKYGVDVIGSLAKKRLILFDAGGNKSAGISKVAKDLLEKYRTQDEIDADEGRIIRKQHYNHSGIPEKLSKVADRFVFMVNNAFDLTNQNVKRHSDGRMVSIQKSWKQIKSDAEKLGIAVDYRGGMYDPESDLTVFRKLRDDFYSKYRKQASDKSTPTLSTATSVQDLQARFSDKAGTPEYNKKMEELRGQSKPSAAAKKLADKLRASKVDTNNLPGSVTKMGGFNNDKLWNDTIDFIADSIEAGAKIADAIQKGIDYLKNTDYFKGLSKLDQAKHIDAIATELNKIDASDTDIIKERKFFRNIQNADNISAETKELLKTDVDNRFYVVKKNNLSKQQAIDYIDEVGLDQTVKDLLNDAVEMQPDTRNFLSIEAMRQTDNLASKAMKDGDRQTAEGLFETANKLAEKMVKEATILGRAVQSYRTLGSPDRVKYNVRKAVKEKRDELAKRDKDKIESKKTDTKEKVKEAIDETLRDDEVKKKIDKAKRDKNTTDPADTLAKRIVKRMENKPSEFDPVREMVNVLFGKVEQGLTPKEKKKESTIEKLKRIIQNKDEYAKTWEDAKEKVKAIMEDKGFSKEKIEEYNSQLEGFYNEIIGKPYDNKTIAQAINERGGKTISHVVNNIEKAGYDARDIRDDIVERIIYETGASEQQASLFADSIIKDVNDRIKAIKEKNEVKKAQADKRLKERQAELDEIKKQRVEKSGNVPVWGERKNQAAKALVKKLTKNDDKIPTPVQEFATRLNNAIGRRVKELGFADAERKPVSPIDVLKEVLKNRDKYDDVINKAREEVKDQFKDDPETLKILDEYLGQISDKPFSDSMIDAVTREAIAKNDIDINELIRQHYTVYDATKRTLIDKLINDAGLTGEDARVIAEAVSKSFDRSARRRIEGVMKQMLARGTKAATKRKTSTEELIELVNMGAFSDAQFAEWYAKANDWPTITPEQYQELSRLAENVQSAKEGFQKYRATEDLMKFQDKMKGISWGEIGQAFWYANMLSGIPTHGINFLANTLNTLQIIQNAAIRNPKQMPAMLNGMLHGLYRGWYEAGDAWKTGYAPVKSGKLEIPSVLEIVNFKGGKFNPANYAKFVRRAMVASDMIHYSANKEMREYQLAYKQAKADGVKKVTIEEVQERLFNTRQRISEAEMTAQAEGLKGRDFKRRVFELVEQSRPVEIVEDASNFASRATFNHPPEGFLGVLTDGINYVTSNATIGGVSPLKFIVPFTNIISNVANNAIDYTPWGFARAAKGGIGYKNSMFPKEKYRKYTKEERVDEMIKASVGLVTMAALYALSDPGDDDNPTIEITANGTGDIRKNYELRDTGWRPYSIRIGNTWVSYQYTPLSLAFAPIGFIRDRAKYKDETIENSGVAAIIENTFYNTWRFMADMTFLGSMSNFVSAVSSDNPGAGVKMLEKSVGNVIRTMYMPNFYTHLNKAYNEWFNIPTKEAETVWQQLYKDVPFARNKLNDKVNALGDPVVLQTDRVTTDVRHDPVLDFIIKNKAYIGVPKRESIVIEYPTQRFATEDEYHDFLVERGKLIRRDISNLMKNSKGWSEEDIKSEINRIRDKATKAAKYIVFSP